MSLHYVTALLEFQITEGVSDFKCLKFRLCDCLEEQYLYFVLQAHGFCGTFPKFHYIHFPQIMHGKHISNSEGDVGGVRSKPQNRI